MLNIKKTTVTLLAAASLIMTACGGYDDQPSQRGTTGKGDSICMTPEGCIPPPGTCFSNDDCGADQYCEFGDGACRLPTLTIMSGECKMKPDACYALYAPVCGCDNKTYGNDCEAHAAGVSVAEQGECNVPPPPPPPTHCGPFPGGECPAGQVCDLQSCGLGGSGVCKVLGKCNKDLIPVCGCDGQTYTNDCMRLAAGVALDHRGACQAPPPGQCTGNDDCGADEYCEFGDGACLLPTLTIMTGECKTKPDACYAVYAPVCGCDGQSYGNDCEAHAAGTSVASVGLCK